MPPHVLLSSERNDWQTPEWFLDLVRAVGRISTDPATTIRNPTGARFAYVQRFQPDGLVESCGLSRSWPVAADGEIDFANPPYGAHLSGAIDPQHKIMRRNKATGLYECVGVGIGWGERLAGRMDLGHSTLALTPVRTETAWWRRLWSAADLALFWSSDRYGSRISFINPDNGKPAHGSNLASTVFFRGTPDLCARFRDVFGEHGTLSRAGGFSG